MSILFSRRFLPLFISQFTEAFNNTIYKNAFGMLLTYRTASANPHHAQLMIAISTGFLVLPYFLFSATAGQLADKYERSKLARLTKLADLVLMVLTAIGFYWGNEIFLVSILFGIGTMTTIFGPIKYALIPQHLQEHEVLAGNAYIEASTFLAIMSGAIIGGLLILLPDGNFLMSSLLISCAIGGYISSRYIPHAPSPDPSLRLSKNILRETWHIIHFARESKEVFLSILGVSWFWLLGTIFLSQFPAYAKNTVHSDQTVVTLFFALFSLGIGAGSVLCVRLLKGRIATTYMIPSMIGISCFIIDFYFATGHAVYKAEGALGDIYEFLSYMPNLHLVADLFLMSMCGGVFMVPLYSIMQSRSAVEHRARIIAANNIVNAVFIVGAALMMFVLLKFHFTVPQMFLITAVLNGFATLYTYKALHGTAPAANDNHFANTDELAASLIKAEAKHNTSKGGHSYDR